MQDSAALERTAGEALQMMAEAVYAGGFLDFRPSLVAAGVLTSARRAAGAWPFWPSSLALLTGALSLLVGCGVPHIIATFCGEVDRLVFEWTVIEASLHLQC
jgi:hypothetical protein